MSVVVDKLTKTYGNQKALDEISFEVRPGEIVGFLGPNGAGKSTTMKILTGYIPQTSGTAMVEGFDIEKHGLRSRAITGYLPEANPLYADMYIKEYLLFVADSYRLGKAAGQAAEKMINQTGLTPERKKKIGQLSKGYKQRVGLAAAMIHDPKVLILDEPTSGLDPNQVEEIRRLIKTFGTDKTVVLSTHIMQEVEAMCNRVLIINRGKIVADDKIENLRAHLSTGTIIEAEFKNPVDTHELMQIPGVTSATLRGNMWIIRAQRDIREDIATFAMSRNNLVLSMNRETGSLEEIFQSLTRDKKPNA
jgi:ABC-2 type transport system ATP-binding protein